jgi:hypothetical protein
MQYDLNLLPNGSQRLEVSGRFFKYVSGAGKIRVTTSKGAVIDLIVGQGVWGEEFSSLVVQDRSGAANVGVLLAGNYDFRDDTVAINGAINVGNSTANRVQVQDIISYSGNFSDTGLVTATTSIVPAAGNVNGVYVDLFSVALSSAGGTATAVQLLAKATAPVALCDGDVLYSATLTGGTAGSGSGFTGSTNRRIFVSPGKGLWLRQDVLAGALQSPTNKSALFTVL